MEPTPGNLMTRQQVEETRLKMRNALKERHFEETVHPDRSRRSRAAKPFRRTRKTLP